MDFITRTYRRASTRVPASSPTAPEVFAPKASHRVTRTMPLVLLRALCPKPGATSWCVLSLFFSVDIGEYRNVRCERDVTWVTPGATRIRPADSNGIRLSEVFRWTRSTTTILSRSSLTVPPLSTTGQVAPSRGRSQCAPSFTTKQLCRLSSRPGFPRPKPRLHPPQAAILGDVTDLIAIPLGDGTQILATVKTNAQGVHTIGLQCDEGKPGLVVRVWAFSKSRHNL